jgi:hypothetical protein
VIGIFYFDFFYRYKIILSLFCKALCSDGSYSRFLITPKGECIQDQSRQFLEVGEDGLNLTGATAN